jgi:hypothetical protein
MVGVTGLEPATSRPPAVRASQLRYTPELKWLGITEMIKPDRYQVGTLT